MKITFSLVILALLNSGVNAQWQQTNGPTGGLTRDVTKISDHIFVNGQSGGIFRSDDNGVSWAPVNTGLPSYPLCYALIAREDKLYAAIDEHGMYYSEDLGETWGPINGGLNSVTFYALVVNGQEIYAGDINGGFYYSSNHGETWSLHEGMLKDVRIRDFVISGNRIFAAAYGNVEKAGIYVSQDKGSTWRKLSLAVTEVEAMAGFDNALYVSERSLMVSRDYGETWETASLGPGSYSVKAIHATGDQVIIGASAKRILYSDDEGRTWTSKLNTSPDNEHLSILAEGNEFWLATWNGMYYSADHGDSWKEVNLGLRNQMVGRLSVDGDTLMVVATSIGLYNSWDEGSQWSRDTIDIVDYGAEVVQGLYAANGYRVISTFNGLFETRSLRKGWSPIESVDNTKPFTVIAGEKDRIVAGVYGQGVYVSEDLGAGWVFKPADVFDGKAQNCSAVKGDTIVIGGSSGILISTNFGDNWKETNLPQPSSIVSLLFDGSSLIAVTATQGILKSSDLGQTWRRIDDLPSHLRLLDLLINEGIYYAGTYEGVYISYNHGVNWYPVNTGLQRVVTSLGMNSDKLFCGTFGMGVWSIAIGELNAKPVITQQKQDFIITDQEKLTFTLDDFDISHPDDETLTLVIGEGLNYTVTENVIRPAAGFTGELTIPVQVHDGVQRSDVFNATVRVVRVVGTEEVDRGLKVYPNPVTDRIYIEGSTVTDFRIFLMDQLGRVVYEYHASAVIDLTIDLSSISSGLYVLHVVTSNKSKVLRLSRE